MRGPILLAALALAAPAALAHGDAPEPPLDPLEFPFQLYLADGGLTFDAPATGETPLSDGRFVLDSPIAFSALSTVTGQLTLRVPELAPGVPGSVAPPGSNRVRVALVLGDAVLSEQEHELEPLSQEPTVVIDIGLQAAQLRPGQGEPFGLQVTWEPPGADQVRVVLGGNASALAFEGRAPDLDALEHDHPVGATHTLRDEAELPTDGAVLLVSINNDQWIVPPDEVDAGEPAYVVVDFFAHEDVGLAYQHPDKGQRDARAPRVRITVDEAAPIESRLYPGEVLTIALGAVAGDSVSFECVESCPGTFRSASWPIAVPVPPQAVNQTQNADDAGDGSENELPTPVLPLLAAAGIAAWRRASRRR